MALSGSQGALAGLGMGLQLATKTMNVTARDLAAQLLLGLNSTNKTVSTGILHLLGNLTGHETNITVATRTLSAYERLPYTGMGWLTIANIVMPSVVFAAVVLRLYSRAVFTGRIKGDDWTIAVSMGLCIYQCAYFAYLISHGFGRHQWDVTFSDIRLNLKLAFFGGLCYVICKNLIKISLCIFYLTLSIQRWFRICIYAVFTFMCALTIVNITVWFLICSPVNYWDHLTTMKCLDKEAIYLADCIITILADIFVLGLPMLIVGKLKLKVRERCVVVGMFALGFFATLVTGLRFRIVKSYGDNSDITASSPLVTFYVMLEQNLGIFLACVPMLRNLFIRYAPRVLGYSPSPPSYDRTPPAGTDGSGGTTVTTKSSRSGRSGGGKIDYDEIIRRYAIPKVGEEEGRDDGGSSSGNLTTTTLATSDLGIGRKITEKADEEMQVRGVRTGEQIE